MLHRVLVALFVFFVAPTLAWAESPPSEPLAVLDVSTRTFDDAPAIAVVFSEPLSKERRYEHLLLVEDKRSELVNGAWVLSKNQRTLYFTGVEPATTYNVWVRSGLRAESGAKLEAAVQKHVTLRALEPSAGFASRGAVLPSKLGRGLPVMSVNVDAVDVDFLKVDNYRLARFLNDFDSSARTSIYQLDRMKEMANSVFRGRFDLNTTLNRRSVTQLPVRDIDELAEPGLYVAVLSKPGDYSYQYDTSYFFVSDLGLHTRVYEGSLGVYVTSLASAQPVAGVSVQLYDKAGKPLDSAVTDASGKVRLNRSDKARTLIARKGDDIAFQRLTGPALDLSEHDLAGRPSRHMELFAYGPRDLYRPGEKVELSILLRDSDGRLTPEIPLSAALHRPDGRLVREFVLQPRSQGYYQRSLNISDDAQTGMWSMELRTDPASKEPAQVYRFSVEDFLPERLKLALNADEKVLLPGDNLHLDVQGDWLWGVAAAKLKLESVLTLRRNVHPLAEEAEFHFGNPDDSTRFDRRDLDDRRLDDQGKAVLDLHLGQGELASPMQINLVESLYEPGGRPVTRVLSRQMWPAEQIIGIRPLFADDTAASESNAEFEIIRVDVSGRRLPASELLVRMVREERDYFWINDEQDGWHRSYSEHKYPVFTENVDIEVGASVRVSVPVEWGGYRLEVEDPETGLTTLYRFDAGWSDDDATGARPDKVVLSLDQAHYQAGDVVRLQVTPPHGGSALVMVEGKTLLWSERRDVPAEGGVFEIPVSADWSSHDVYISAVVFRPVTEQQAITPTRAVGLTHLDLDRRDRKLTLSLEAPESMRPEQDLRVTVNTGVSDEKVRLTLAAVDVGVLNITRFKTPDPYKWFFAKRSYGVDMRDIYGNIIETLDGPKAALRSGGDAEAGAAGARASAKPRIVALFSGVVSADAEGQAQVTLPVPDFNGRLRLMAVGFADQKFGSAESEVIVAAPVIAELSTPRFLASGDKTMATLLLQNASDQEQDLQMTLSASAPLQMDEHQQRIQLKPGESRTLSVPLSAANGFAQGAVSLRLSGGDIDLQRQWPLVVRPAWPGERRVARERINPGETRQLDAALVKGLMPDTVTSSLLISDQPPMDLAGALEGLMAYPYGCLEQSASRAWPLLYMAEAVKQLGVEAVPLAQRNRWVDEAIARIAGMQLHNGGFGLWSSNSSEEAWLSPYVTSFLLDAGDHGYAVPRQVLVKALKRLKRRVVRPGGMSHFYSESPKHLSLAAKAYASYVLARAQVAPLAALRLVYDRYKTDAKSALPLVHLSLALTMAGDKRRGKEALELAFTVERDDTLYLGDYGSRLRDQAMILGLLLRHYPEHEQIETLALSVSDLLLDKPWLSTQEQLAVLQAGLALTQASGKPWKLALRDAVGETLIQAAGRERRGLELSALQQGMSLENQGEQALYSSLQISGYPLLAPKTEQGPISIERHYYRPDGSLLSENRVKAGELLLVHIQLSSERNMEHALVADLLPAGFEIENSALNQGERLADFQIPDLDMEQAIYGTDIHHREFRDDRYVAALSLGKGREANMFYLVRAVTPGEYTLPPVLVEDMYRPEFRAVGDSWARVIIDAEK